MKHYSFGSALAQEIQSRGLTQQTIADAVSINQTMIGKYISKNQIPRPDNLEKICDYLDVKLVFEMIPKKDDNYKGILQVIYNSPYRIRIPINCSSDVDVFLRLDFPDINFRESCYALFCDQSNNLITKYLLSTGSTISSVIDKSLVCKCALLANSHSVILAHNHPSGNLKPSKADIILTAECYDALKTIGIPLRDHLIISPEAGNYYSFADDGMLGK